MADAPTLAEVTAEAQTLFAQIQSKGINAADKGEIVTSAKALLAILNKLQPHLNSAATAFGNQDANVTKINALRNQLNKIVSVYNT
jgi:inhibitor of KinA sporulation pathway (predicted exonuclease)